MHEVIGVLTLACLERRHPDATAPNDAVIVYLAENVAQRSPILIASLSIPFAGNEPRYSSWSAYPHQAYLGRYMQMAFPTQSERSSL